MPATPPHGGHYFSADPGPATQRPIRVDLAGRELTVHTAPGVFSPGGVDPGTRVLLRAAPDPPTRGDLLDLGCGWGPIAMTLALSSPEATVWAVEVNPRALELVRRNAADHGLRIRAASPEDVPEHLRFAAIWSNPPIRVGKPALHGMLLRWLPRLAPDAAAHLVVQRHLGADSLHRWLQDRGMVVARLASAKGYRVLRVSHPS